MKENLVQANSGAGASVGEVNEPAEQLRERVAMIIARYIGYGFEHPRQHKLEANEADWRGHFEERERRLFRELADKVLEQINVSGAEVTSPNGAESDAVSLNQNCNAYGSTDALRSALAELVGDVLHYERTNGLYPNPGRKFCWQSTENACALLISLGVTELPISGDVKARTALSTEGLREWQPIETAPKDGRSILIAGGTYRYSGETFPEDRPYEHVAKAAYVDGEWFGGFGSEYDESYSHSPTHWMPLPPAPDAARTALAGITAHKTEAVTE